MAISLIINGKEAALKKGASIEYVSENRIFTDASSGQSSKKRTLKFKLLTCHSAFFFFILDD